MTRMRNLVVLNLNTFLNDTENTVIFEHALKPRTNKSKYSLVMKGKGL